MKKILYMSGAVVNAGDFLIEMRAKALLDKFIPNVDITVVNRVGVDYSNKMDFLNNFDAIVFAGGPLYQISIYPYSIPFVKKSQLGRVKIPILFMGGGIRSDVYSSRMSKDTLTFLKKGTERGLSLGCRDILSYRFMKQQGFSENELLMTGCPAWYSLDHVDRIEVNRHYNKKIKICVSEPAKTSNVSLMVSLLYRLRDQYRNAEITLVIHRENKRVFKKLLLKLKEDLDISCNYISGTAEGFSVYNNCDMHIGFRVHAHIYNLSVRNISYLINEDIRGIGVNQTLGLENVNIENYLKREIKLFGDYFIQKKEDNEQRNMNVINHVFDCIESSEKCNYQNYRDAYAKMIATLPIMRTNIEMLGF